MKFRPILHFLVVCYAAVLSYVLSGLILGFYVEPDVFFGLSIVLLLFAVVQSIYELTPKRAILFFLITATVGFVAEVFGTNLGLPFGRYHYTDFLGERIFGVPVVVPLVWFVISYLTFSMTFSNFRHDRDRSFRRGLALCSLAAFGSVAWDLLIDPMFSTYQYWIWDVQSFAVPTISGIPVTNYVGWFILVFFMLSIFFIYSKREKDPEMFLKENTWDSRIVYALLLIDGAIANLSLDHMLVTMIGIVAMSSFLGASYLVKGLSIKKPKNMAVETEKINS